MPLQKAPISVVLSGGLNTKVDPKLAVAGQLLEMENVWQEREGELRKRNGCRHLSTAIAGGGNVTTGRKLTTFGDELLLTDANSVYSYADAAEQWVAKGSSSAFTVGTKPVIANAYEQTNQDGCYIGGMAVFAWEDTRGGVRYSVQDYATGQFIVTDAVGDASGSRPRVVGIGTNAFIFYVTLGTTSLKVAKIRLSEPTSIAAFATLVTDTNAADALYDVIANTANSAMLVAYRNTAGDVTTMYVLPSLGVAGPGVSGLPPATTNTLDCNRCISWLYQDFATGIYLATAGTTDGVQVTAYDSHLILQSTQVAEAGVLTANQLTGYYDPATATKTLFYEVNNATAINTKTRRWVEGTGAADFMLSLGLASKVFSVGGLYYLNLAYGGADQATYFTVSSGGEVVARVLSTIGGGLIAKRSQLPGAWAVDANKVLTSALRKTKLVSENARLFTLRGVNALLLDYNDEKLGSYKQLGECLHLTGGFLRIYDGHAVVEHGFHLYPEQPALTSANSTGTLTNAGVYQYVIVYSWPDARGQVHRSLASAPKSITLGGADDTVTVVVPTLRVTAHRAPYTNVTIEVFRTENAGTIFYKVTSTTAPTFNSATADTVAFIDTLPDTSIVSREILYTNGGLLDNRPCPPCKALAVWGNRLWAVSSEDGSVWFSKKLVAGEGVAFAAEQVLLLEGGGGEANAIGEMDDKLVTLKRDETFIESGDGPNDTGSPPFANPQRVMTAVGATEPESLIKTPFGLMFKSPKGIYLLDRGLSATYIGAQVEKYNGETITGSVVIDDLNQVRFTTSGGRTLVYDWHFKQWSTFTNQAATGCCVWRNRFAYLRTDGVVAVEDSTFSDAGQYIKTRIATSWLQTSSILGFGRLWELQVLGEGRAFHWLNVSLAFDYEASPSENHLAPSLYYADELRPAGSYVVGPDTTMLGRLVYGAGENYQGLEKYGDQVYAGGDDPYVRGQGYDNRGGRYVFSFKPTRQKCSAFQIIIEDAFPFTEGAGGTEGARYSALGLLIGRKPGLNKVDMNRRF